MSAFLTGDTIDLRPLDHDDIHLFYAWFADRDVVRYALGLWQFPQSRVEVGDWLDRTIHDKGTLSLGITRRDTHELIGYAGITSISVINQSGEYYILIGDKESWGKGYGTEATKLIVDYGFASLNLHRVMLTVSDANVGGVKAYTNAGFIVEGTLRQACYRDGAYHNKIAMSILRPEWESMPHRVPPLKI